MHLTHRHAQAVRSCVLLVLQAPSGYLGRMWWFERDRLFGRICSPTLLGHLGLIAARLDVSLSVFWP
jgi:hypothetical protein